MTFLTVVSYHRYLSTRVYWYKHTCMCLKVTSLYYYNGNNTNNLVLFVCLYFSIDLPAVAALIEMLPAVSSSLQIPADATALERMMLQLTHTFAPEKLSIVQTKFRNVCIAFVVFLLYRFIISFV